MNTPIIHHVSVINRDAKQSFHFYHELLGLDLLMKTVNQEDLDMYHLFFSDTEGRPGTDFTVFEMKNGVDKHFGTNAIERTVFAVPSEDSLPFWENRLNQAGFFNCEIEDYNDSKILRFEDADGVQLGFVPTPTLEETYYARATSDVPLEHAILGIQSVHLRVRYTEASANVLRDFFGLSVSKEIAHGDLRAFVLTREETFLNQEIHLIEDKQNDLEEMGIGGSHHVALAVKDITELKEKEEQILNKNFLNSGIKNREFFQSLYFREPNNVLIEIATVDSGFSKSTDAAYETFSDIPLYLPSFLEPKRSSIENRLVQ